MINVLENIRTKQTLLPLFINIDFKFKMHGNISVRIMRIFKQEAISFWVFLFSFFLKIVL